MVQGIIFAIIALYSGVLNAASIFDSPEWELVGTEISTPGFSPVPDNQYHLKLNDNLMWPSISFDSALWDDWDSAGLYGNDNGEWIAYVMPDKRSKVFYPVDGISEIRLYAKDPSPVPIPSAVLLFGTALVGLFYVARKHA